MAFDASSSCFLRCPTVISTAVVSCASLNRHRFFFFLSSCKTVTNTISCSSGPIHSTRCSYSRRWLNPLRRKPLEDEPTSEIPRRWIDSDPHPLASQERFTVVSYNILGDKNAFKHKDLYPNVPLQFMKWNHRKRLICQELFGFNPDIICMQEVDKYFDLLNVMEKAGYVGYYKRRTGDNVDGCAMFWKADRFRLLEKVSIEFKEFGLRDNVAQLAVFEADVQSRIKKICEKWGNVPVVLAGDFNCTPHSAIYKFLSLSELDIKLYDRRDLSGQRSCHPAQVFGVKKEMSNPFAVIDRFLQNGWTDDEVKVATGNAELHLAVHPLKLNSSYASVKGSTETRNSNGEPLATSYHSKFFGTVDYLWYSNGLVPTRVLDTLPVDILRRTGGLPCKQLGSDHLALVSEFTFARGTNNNEGNNTSTMAAEEAVHTLHGEEGGF